MTTGCSKFLVKRWLIPLCLMANMMLSVEITGQTLTFAQSQVKSGSPETKKPVPSTPAENTLTKNVEDVTMPKIMTSGKVIPDTPQTDRAKQAGLISGQREVKTLSESVRAIPELTRPVFERQVIMQTFDKDAENWVSGRSFRTSIENNALHIEADGDEPLIYQNFKVPEGEVRIRFRMKTETESEAVLQWLTTMSPRRSDDKTVRIKLINDNGWHDYEVILPIHDTLTSLACRLTAIHGTWELDDFAIWVKFMHPLAIMQIIPAGGVLRYNVVNLSSSVVNFNYRGKHYTLDRDQSVILSVEPTIRGSLAVYRLTLEPEGFPEVSYAAFQYRPDENSKWYVMPLGKYQLQVTEDGTMARIQYPGNKKTLAIIAPLMHHQGIIPDFTAENDWPAFTTDQLKQYKSTDEAYRRTTPGDQTLRFHSQSATMSLQTKDDRIEVRLESEEPFEGPVVRVLGIMQNAVMAGCEFLKEGELSSSDIDVVAPLAGRFEPPPIWITMPLMAFNVRDEEERGYDEDNSVTVAMTWGNMRQQPTFLIPNRIDATNDCRMSFRGEGKMEAVIRVMNGPISEAILWAVKRRGLPEPLSPPRTPYEQIELTLGAFRGPLAGNDGAHWGSSAEPDWPRKAYDDFASTIWRLSEKMPSASDDSVPGGSALPNDTIHFLRGNIYEWLDFRRSRVEQILSEMRKDGSFIRHSLFPEYEPSSLVSGYGARRALELMAFVRLTGNKNVFASVTKTIDFIRQFRIPRGGHYWETPLHTPDLLAAAHLVMLHVWAYEFDPKPEYLERARYWAIMGLPFIYLWQDRPKMLYATVPMFGASDRESPVWFGTAQPWCGAVYAYALIMLAKHDDTLDWRKIARGILHTAEAMQFESGPFIGCIPDAYSLNRQESISWHVNPATLVSLRWALETPPDSYMVLVDGDFRIASPFATRLTRKGIVITGAPAGIAYQLLINGNQVIDVKASGTSEDFVPLK
ncbi:MAG: hypothetical protein FWC50_03165 [Planctomycetaceae bacterium]|nr:hypothetical protein [Planctomycetaceae bacterium]